jgi:hypothetical protein
VAHYVSPDEIAFVGWRVGRRLKEAGFSSVVVTPFDWLHPRRWPPLMRVVESAGAILERTPLLGEFWGSLLITDGAVSDSALVNTARVGPTGPVSIGVVPGRRRGSSRIRKETCCHEDHEIH